jgi:hypothetical protein
MYSVVFWGLIFFKHLILCPFQIRYSFEPFYSSMTFSCEKNIAKKNTGMQKQFCKSSLIIALKRVAVGNCKHS